MIAKFGSLDRAQRLYEAVSRVGAQEGIKFDFDRITRTPNTVRSHRLLYAAAEEDKQPALLEAIFNAYFTEGRDIGEPDVLTELGQEAGLSGEALDRLREGEVVDLHHERDGVAALLAAEAVEESLARADLEGRRLLVVERAEPLEVPPARVPQLEVLGHDGVDRNRVPNRLHVLVIDPSCHA